MANNKLDEKQRRTMIIVIVYPVLVALIAVMLNFLAFGVNHFHAALPSNEIISSLIVSSILLVINHSWIMTATELTRVRYRLHATPEEWESSGTSKKDVSERAALEIERVHNTHRNSTENVVYFVLLSLILIFSSPTQLASVVWMIGFAIARLGYTYSYLAGNDNLRGIFMTLSLLGMYGIATYLVISLII